MGPDQAGGVFRLRAGLGSRRLSPIPPAGRSVWSASVAVSVSCPAAMTLGVGSISASGIRSSPSWPMTIPMRNIAARASAMTTAATPRAKFLLTSILPFPVQCMGTDSFHGLIAVRQYKPLPGQADYCLCLRPLETPPLRPP